MATWTEAPGVSRIRWSLAGTLEISLETALTPRHAMNYWPRIPYRNRLAVAEPMRAIVSMLRDPAVEIAEEAMPRILELASHPASPAFGSHPIQARFAAYALLDELRAHADCVPG
jgi:hypothetical protein